MYKLVLITVASLVQGDVQSCNEICESVLFDQSIIASHPNCICFSNEQKPRRTHVWFDDTPFLRVDDRIKYYEPADIYPYQTLPFYDKSFYTINQPNLFPLSSKTIDTDNHKARKMKIPSIVSEQSVDVGRVKEKKINNNIVHKREDLSNLKPTPLYLDIDVMDWNNRRSSFQNHNKIKDFEEIEQILRECIDPYIVFDLRHNNSSNLNVLNETWQNKNLKKYDNISDHELQKEIEVNCKKLSNIMEKSLKGVKTTLRKKKEETFKAASNKNFKVSTESKDIFNSKDADFHNEYSITITTAKPIESLKNMIDAQIETKPNKINMSYETQSDELQIQEKSFNRSEVRNSMSESNKNISTRSTLTLLNETDAVVNLTDKNNGLTFTTISNESGIENIYTTNEVSTKSILSHTTGLFNSIEYNKEHESQTDFKLPNSDQITSSLFIETTTVKDLYDNDELLIELLTTPYSNKTEIDSHKLENKTNSFHNLNNEHLNTNVDNSLIVTFNHSINKNISHKDIDNKFNILVSPKNRGEYRENEIPILKIVTREFANNTVVSSINGTEAIPNNDFSNNESKIISVSANNLNDNSSNDSTNVHSTNYTNNVLRNWDTLENKEYFTEKADVIGNIYFLSDQEEIPARFIQKPSGEIHIGIDGISLCEKLKSENRSVLLTTLCNHIQSNKFTKL